MVRVEDLTVRYVRGGRVIEPVSGVSFALARGELGLLYGRSGSGKSSIINVVAGFIKPHRGRVYVAGVEINRLGWGEANRLRRTVIGYAMQQNILLPRSTVLFNIMLPLIIQGASREEAEDKAAGVAEELGIEGLLDAKAYSLSGGEARRVVVARALATGRPLLLLDEPTSNLDEETSLRVWRAIESRRRSGATILVATHDQAGARYADKIIEVSPS